MLYSEVRTDLERAGTGGKEALDKTPVAEVASSPDPGGVAVEAGDQYVPEGGGWSCCCALDMYGDAAVGAEGAQGDPSRVSGVSNACRLSISTTSPSSSWRPWRLRRGGMGRAGSGSEAYGETGGDGDPAMLRWRSRALALTRLRREVGEGVLGV